MMQIFWWWSWPPSILRLFMIMILIKLWLWNCPCNFLLKLASWEIEELMSYYKRPQISVDVGNGNLVCVTYQVPEAFKFHTLHIKFHTCCFNNINNRHPSLCSWGLFWNRALYSKSLYLFFRGIPPQKLCGRNTNLLNIKCVHIELINLENSSETSLLLLNWLVELANIQYLSIGSTTLKVL